MNPHFIFNSLNSIENFIMKNDKLQASNYLNKFAKLIRSVLENTKQGELLLRSDIESLKLYIELEQLRFNNKFSVEYEIEETLLQSNYLVPAFLLQPFVENAILHGINHSPKINCFLTIEIKEEVGYLIAKIVDDGIGIEASKKINAKKLTKSEGMSITKMKLKHFNQNKFENDVIINPNTNNEGMEEGTKVELRILKKFKK
jgi:LytS/YehU family sensor histidine kinase